MSVKRIAVRELTEDEARRHTGIAPPRFVIVDADNPTEGLHYGLAGAFGRPEGSDWLHVTILEARRAARRWGAALVLTHEQAIVERIGKAIDLNRGWPHDLDGATAKAKLDAIARAAIPEAYLMLDGNARRRRERREREDRLRLGHAAREVVA